MSEQEEEFKGFAELLFDDLSQMGLVALADPRNMGGNLDLAIKLQEEMNRLTKQIIAKRAYDLVEHTLHTVNDNDNLMMGMWSTEDIPDLTQWTEQPNE